MQCNVKKFYAVEVGTKGTLITCSARGVSQREVLNPITFNMLVWHIFTPYIYTLFHGGKEITRPVPERQEKEKERQSITDPIWFNKYLNDLEIDRYFAIRKLEKMFIIYSYPLVNLCLITYFLCSSELSNTKWLQVISWNSENIVYILFHFVLLYQSRVPSEGRLCFQPCLCSQSTALFKIICRQSLPIRLSLFFIALSQNNRE